MEHDSAPVMVRNRVMTHGVSYYTVLIPARSHTVSVGIILNIAILTIFQNGFIEQI